MNAILSPYVFNDEIRTYGDKMFRHHSPLFVAVTCTCILKGKNEKKRKRKKHGCPFVNLCIDWGLFFKIKNWLRPIKTLQIHKFSATQELGIKNRKSNFKFKVFFDQIRDQILIYTICRKLGFYER